MTKRWSSVVCVLLLLAAGSAWAFEEAQDDDPGELRRAIRRYFDNRLRQELNLSDEEMEQILPHVEALEQQRVAARRERARLVHRLQLGLRSGAGDAELQQGLDRLERIDDEQRRTQRKALAQIDDLLTVRQRVQLRFFVERFRSDVQRRIRELRGEGLNRRGFERRRRLRDDGP